MLISTKQAAELTGLSEYELRYGFKRGLYPALEVGARQPVASRSGGIRISSGKRSATRCTRERPPATTILFSGGDVLWANMKGGRAPAGSYITRICPCWKRSHLRT